MCYYVPETQQPGPPREGNGEEKLNKQKLCGIQSAGFCFLASLDFNELSWANTSTTWDLGSAAKKLYFL